ncbi:MAG: hypothetical protein AAGA56_11280 [Myxococcota bacterium]
MTHYTSTRPSFPRFFLIGFALAGSMSACTADFESSDDIVETRESALRGKTTKELGPERTALAARGYPYDGIASKFIRLDGAAQRAMATQFDSSVRGTTRADRTRIDSFARETDNGYSKLSCHVVKGEFGCYGDDWFCGCSNTGGRDPEWHCHCGEVVGSNDD